MRCGAFHRVEGTLCLVRHGQAALSGSKTKAPGFAGGYLINSASSIRFPTAALPSTALRPHAVLDDPDTLDFAAHEIARLQESLRIHEVGNAGRGPRCNHIAGKDRHRTGGISHQRLV